MSNRSKINLDLVDSDFFQSQNRRYLGNKYKLIEFIKDIVSTKCGHFNSFCDMFSGTGVVGNNFNDNHIKIIANDILYSNYIGIKTFLSPNNKVDDALIEKINHLNDLEGVDNGYFSANFGGTFFSQNNARKIDAIREELEVISTNENDRDILLCSLLYAVDKVANTVGHYDAFIKKLDNVKTLKLLIPDIQEFKNSQNVIYREDANDLIRKISCDVLYLDPPYNSRQYSDYYHLLENLSEWKKPNVKGITKKMDRSHIKSDYCLKNATQVFEDLIINADCKHILLSYNNTANSKNGRSNAKIEDAEIIRILKNKGEIEIFEREYKAFSTGKSSSNGNIERIFYCKVRR